MTIRLDQFLEEYKHEAKKSVGDIDKDKISKIVGEIESVSRQGGKIYTVGNGGSSSTAKHLASDLDKTANLGVEFDINASSLVSNESLLTAWTNDDCWDSVYKQQLKGKISENDMLIAISVHGGTDEWSDNLVNAIDYSNSQGAKTVGLAGFDGGKFTNLCDQTVIISKESTILVESLHVLVHHLIVYGLKRCDL